MGEPDDRSLNVFTFNRAWFMAAIMSLEALRRGQAGALMIGVFITEDTALSTTIFAHTQQLELLANLVLQMIDELPPAVSWVASPFYDYSLAII